MNFEPELPVTARLKKKRRSRFSYSLFAIFSLIFLAAIGITAALALWPSSSSATGSLEQAEIRAFLSENLDSGQWDEVKWYPTVKAKDGTKYVRLKFRTTNRFGATELVDLVFQFTGGNMMSHGKYSVGFYNLWNE